MIRSLSCPSRSWPKCHALSLAIGGGILVSIGLIATLAAHTVFPHRIQHIVSTGGRCSAYSSLALGSLLIAASVSTCAPSPSDQSMQTVEISSDIPDRTSGSEESNSPRAWIMSPARLTTNCLHEEGIAIPQPIYPASPFRAHTLERLFLYIKHELHEVESTLDQYYDAFFYLGLPECQRKIKLLRSTYHALERKPYAPNLLKPLSEEVTFVDYLQEMTHLFCCADTEYREKDYHHHLDVHKMGRIGERIVNHLANLYALIYTDTNQLNEVFEWAHPLIPRIKACWELALEEIAEKRKAFWVDVFG